MEPESVLVFLFLNIFLPPWEVARGLVDNKVAQDEPQTPNCEALFKGGNLILYGTFPKLPVYFPPSSVKFSVAVETIGR